MCAAAPVETRCASLRSSRPSVENTLLVLTHDLNKEGPADPTRFSSLMYSGA